MFRGVGSKSNREFKASFEGQTLGLMKYAPNWWLNNLPGALIYCGL